MKLRPEAREALQAIGIRGVRQLLESMPSAEQQGKFPIPGIGTPNNRVLANEAQAWIRQNEEVTQNAEAAMLKAARNGGSSHERRSLRLSVAQTVIAVLALVAGIVAAWAAIYPLTR